MKKLFLFYIIMILCFSFVYVPDKVQADSPTLVQSGINWNKYRFSPTEYQMEFSGSPINYYDGEWKPIDPDFKVLPQDHIARSLYNYYWYNEEGLFTVYLKRWTNKSYPVAFAYNKSGDPTTHVLRSKLMGVGYLDPSQGNEYVILQNVLDSQGIMDDNTITYPGVFTGASASWTYQADKLKEEITLSEDAKTTLQDNPPSNFGLSNQNSYFVLVTRLDYQNLYVYNGSIQEGGNFTTDGDVTFKDVLGAVKFAFPVGYIYEQADDENINDLTYRVIQHNNNYYLLSGLKVTTLNSMNFPVVIDPSLEVEGHADDTQLTAAESVYNTAWTATSGNVGGGDDARVGQNFYGGDTYAVTRSVFYFDTSSLPSSAILASGYLQLSNEGDYSYDDPFFIVIQNDTTGVSPHKPPNKWDFNKANYTGDGGSRIASDFPYDGTPRYITFNSSGVDMIQKGDWTKFIIRSSRDIAGTTPTGGEYIDIITADYVIASLRPKLYVNYTTTGIITGESTNVEETTATLNAVYYGSGTATCGFWIGNISTNYTNFEQNVTCDGTYEFENPFTKSVTGLTSGEYYYIRGWAFNATGFYNDTTTETYFLTKPDVPTSLTATGTNGTNISLSWTNASVGSGTQQQTIIMYKTTGYPTSVSDGTEGYNDTAEETTIEDLYADTTYYFSAFTYVSGSSSPSYYRVSDSWDTATAETGGGNYTIYVRYENATNVSVDLNRSGPHRFVFHSEEREEVVIFNYSGNNVEFSELAGDFSTNSSGYFTVTMDQPLDYVELFYNQSQEYRCERIQVIRDGVTNITFYVITDALVYLEGSAFENDTLVKYTYDFLDNPGVFLSDPTSFAYLYFYNSTGDRVEVHSEYLDTYNTIHPMLQYRKKYYIGINCSTLTIDNCGIAPTFEDVNPFIEIPFATNITYFFHEIFDITIGWMDGDTGFYVNYLDTMSGLTEMTFRVYDHNGVLVFTNTSTEYSHNFTYPSANQSRLYRWELSVNHTESLYNTTYSSSVIPGMSPIVNYDDLNTILTYIFGESPFVSESGEDTVSLVNALIFGFGFFLFISFNVVNAEAGGIVMGAWYTAAPLMISGVETGFIPIGIFIISIAIVSVLWGE